MKFTHSLIHRIGELRLLSDSSNDWMIPWYNRSDREQYRRESDHLLDVFGKTVYAINDLNGLQFPVTEEDDGSFTVKKKNITGAEEVMVRCRSVAHLVAVRNALMEAWMESREK